MNKQNCIERLAELENIKAGWLDGEGQAADKPLLTWFKKAFEQLPDGFFLDLGIFPHMESGYLLEWFLPGEKLIQLEVASLVDVNTVNGKLLLIIEDKTDELDVCTIEDFLQISHLIAMVKK